MPDNTGAGRLAAETTSARHFLTVLFILATYAVLGGSSVWLLATQRSGWRWFATVALLCVAAVVAGHRTPRFRQIMPKYEASIAKGIGPFLLSRIVILGLNFAPYFLMKLIAATVLALGLYQGSVQYSSGLTLSSYVTYVAAVFAWALTLAAEGSIEHLRVHTESQLDGRLVGIHNVLWGNRLEWFGFLGGIGAA